MRVFNQGAFIRVTASCDDIESFAAKWPCNGFRYGDRASFTFQTSNGDLVDLGVWGTYNDPYQGYNESALGALADDCKDYAKSKGLIIG